MKWVIAETVLHLNEEREGGYEMQTAAVEAEDDDHWYGKCNFRFQLRRVVVSDALVCE